MHPNSGGGHRQEGETAEGGLKSRLGESPCSPVNAIGKIADSVFSRCMLCQFQGDRRADMHTVNFQKPGCPVLEGQRHKGCSRRHSGLLHSPPRICTSVLA